MRTLIVILLIAALVVVVSAVLKESEFRQASYATYPELRASGTFAGGWIPGWFPSSATRIQTGHDLDTNESLLGFTIPDATSWAVQACTETTQWTEPSDRARALAGWPESFDPPAFSVYQCHANGRSGFLAKRGAEIWYWESGY